MGLTEDAIMQAVTDNPPDPVSQGVSSPNLDALVNAGKLRRLFVGGNTSYEQPNGLPVGAVEDAGAPMGYTIADPRLRDMASNAQGALAGAVAQNRYMDAFERDRLKNTLAIQTAARGLEPDAQNAVMRQLGLNVGGPGEMSAKLRDELAKLKYAHELGAPDREIENQLKAITAQVGVMNAKANQGYKDAIIGKNTLGSKIQMMAHLNEIAKEYSAQAGPMGNPQAAQVLKNAMDVIQRQIDSIDTTGGGGGATDNLDFSGGAVSPQSMNPNRTPSLSELNPPDNTTPWWDQAMPSGREWQPDTGKIKMLQQRLAELQKFAPGDVGAQMAIQRQIKDLLAPPLATPGAGGGSNIAPPPGTPGPGEWGGWGGPPAPRGAGGAQPLKFRKVAP